MSGSSSRAGLIVGTMLVILVVSGVGAYLWLRPSPRVQQGDPAVALAVAVAVLDQRPDTRLTPTQAEQMLPYLRVLRDTDVNDVEASRALIEQIRSMLTPEQLAAMRQLREQFRVQRPPDGTTPQGPPGLRPGGGDRTGLRRQILGRLIDQLQTRVRSSS